MRTPPRKSRRSIVEIPDRESALDREAPRAHEEILPVIAIVGRPNVGKSTLFNRLAGRRRALVHETPGMTRDRRIDRIEWDGHTFLCVDTGGFDIAVEDPLYESVVDQALMAIEEADVIVFLTAVGEERHPAEHELVQSLRKSGKPVVVAVNKCDNPSLENEAQAFYRYGFKEIFPVSALHGRNVGAMLDAVMEKIDGFDGAGRLHVSGGIALAVVGRQNVGKSSLINQILGTARLIASELPGTTRDAIDTVFQTEDGQAFTLIDTAGIRRRGKVERGIEKICVLSSMIAIRRADVAAIVVDGPAGLTAQDAHIASYCVAEGCACLLVVNKWDLVEKDHRTADRFTKTMEREWPFLRYAPVLYTSALTGQRAPRILEVAREVYANAGRRIPTGLLNEHVEKWLRRKAPPIRKNRQLKIKYCAQTGTHPPRFTFFVNNPELVHFSYERYLINRIREVENFEGTPVRAVFRAKGRRDEPRTIGPG